MANQKKLLTNHSKYSNTSSTTSRVIVSEALPARELVLKKTDQPQSELLKSSCNEGQHYRIEIPENVEKIIRTYCANSPDNEWSGVLFYTVEGDFESSELTVVCKDIFLMDIGSATFTEYKFDSADVASYIAQNPNLMGCYTGLVHSHDRMAQLFDTQLVTN